MAKVSALEALSIERREIDESLLTEHLQAFAKAFVYENYYSRIEKLIDRDPWIKATKEIEKHLNEKFCSKSDEQSRPDVWNNEFSGKEGIYIASDNIGLLMSLEEASKVSLLDCTDAIFSLEAGKLAVFLNHEWGVWYCRHT